MPQVWVYNGTNNGTECGNKFKHDGNYKMGINQTYDLTAILFYIVGMVFGQSYSVQHVKPLLWVQTSPCKRMIRTLLGVTLAGLLYSPFYFGSRNTTS